MHLDPTSCLLPQLQHRARSERCDCPLIRVVFYTTALFWAVPHLAPLFFWATFTRLAGLTVISAMTHLSSHNILSRGSTCLTSHGAGAMGSILQLLSRLLVLLVCVLSRMHAYVAAHHPTTNTISTPLQSILRRPATCRYKSIYSAWWRVLLTRHRKSKICVM